MADHQGVAVGRSLRDRARADGAGSAAAVIDYELLAERASHVLAKQARHDVVAAARREGTYDRDRTCWIGLGRHACWRGRDSRRNERYCECACEVRHASLHCEFVRTAAQIPR